MPMPLRHTLRLIGGLALLALAPRPAEAQAVSYCQGRLVGTNFCFAGRVVTPSSTELRYNMVLQNPTRISVNDMVRFLHPGSSGGQINRLMTLAAGQQQVVLLGVETMHPDLAGDLMRDDGTRFLVESTRVDCGG
ncbi:hypothetical protein KTR66_07285 [Roseococcus sp. SDR]|uniref:hypothetical protein n=1 Tax=Roseococcus sp. SDR TaxID=2835532 RepID=UPI001BCC929A|nr:hypothetical protein [Roseococcus sp. SDR]MBS7789790.1 hypothetical protein [Roseococcus sp. SDR]MBV1845104.1 hypothetical protein [Roseococcus sp. SDR]